MGLYQHTGQKGTTLTFMVGLRGMGPTTYFRCRVMVNNVGRGNSMSTKSKLPVLDEDRQMLNKKLTNLEESRVHDEDSQKGNSLQGISDLALRQY